MGAVYRAHDPTLQRTVAIKVLTKQNEDASARLLQEARAASALNHPHICTIHEVGEHEGQAFIVMEHVEGKPLSALIPADGLPPESVIRYGTQIADALAHAHERGIVHRDLKSQNVVITPEGRAKVLDFGLAARMPQADAEMVTKTQDALPHAGMLVGTLAYMAPEVLRGEAATARSDIWALGGCCCTRWRVESHRSVARHRQMSSRQSSRNSPRHFLLLSHPACGTSSTTA